MTDSTVRIGDTVVGGGSRCFVTLEAGPTHSGLDSALALVRHAAAAGADAVKFQIIDPDRLVADRKQPFTYEVLVDRTTGATEEVTEPLYDILSRRAMGESDWRSVRALCAELGLGFFCTVMFDNEVDFVVALGCQSIKIASGDLNHFPLLKKAARTGLNLQIDTGSGTIGEVEAAVDVIRREGNENIIIHHCPSGYPAHLASINLRVITTLRQMFHYPIAFSDHSPGWDMDIAAVTLGASLVEKTITLDRTTRSVEHVMSLEPDDAKRFIGAIRDLEVALGKPRREMSETEATRRNAVRRSIFLAEAAPAGARLGDVAVDFRRPGFGIGPEFHESLLDRQLKQALPAGHMLTLSDLD